MKRSERPLSKLLGENIRRQRTQLGLSQSAVARRVHVSVELVSRIERGVGFPSVPTLVGLASALGTTPDGLLGVAATETPPELDALAAIVGDLSPARRQDVWAIAETFARRERRDAPLRRT